MASKNYTRISKFISLILRHKPETIGIKLDKHGWADVKELLKGVNISMEELEHIVDTDEKQRYSFNDNKTKIRANQGHSIEVDLELEPIEPPEYLYHGTATKFIGDIMKNGLQKQSRQYVHLSKDLDTAKKVGVRHGELVLLRINTLDMYRDGYKFYLSKNGVWLTDLVPVKYITRC